MTMSDINALDHDAFLARVGPVFEHSPWIAQRAWAARPFDGVAGLHQAMMAVVAAASADEQVALLQAHPDLAGKAARAGSLTADSTREQAGAGLDRLSDTEYDRFDRLNRAYRERFGFPFIVAVKRHTKESILAACEARLGNDRATEIGTALAEVGLITRLRLDALFGD
ncbi:2-oxo-4-hydroxy-4-carboxy-5-ureidoimidazoline decarboxylase [Vineibacter terrae]|uniref:2-oxo-4-hydroxy-4-carboxy-5-ureidoimidazoline decarboxylase n=1 Tax=Vineibacter terrae TaxID=2586908 RepID=A0A5C8PFL0_9HYPH|nr:2-oxo-4-hydroxy-4-carboxy-5-ureidoimidazoline decarboxylase [Vineibacter terrae]TXL71959.1 2-oxo-4-hydroxy-4-carboxy-5-ureidoimidazoline decarboxylase [Vineibacter terrae]